MQNYFENKRLSNSTYKAYKKCPAQAHAVENKLWEIESRAFLIGTYVDYSLLEPANLPAFLEKNAKAMFKKPQAKMLVTKPKSITIDDWLVTHPWDYKLGDPYADIVNADNMIIKARDDEGFMQYLSGNHQVEREFEIDGVEWKGKLDVLNEMFIADLKTTASVDKWEWVPEFKQRLPFYWVYRYDLQGAVYQAAVGEKLPFYMPTLGKDGSMEVFHFPQIVLDQAMDEIIATQETIVNQRLGNDLWRCETCDYCKATKRIGEPKTIYMLSGDENDEF